MKKLLTVIAATAISASLHAQSSTAESGGRTRNKDYSADSLLSRWCIDLNLTGGMMSQSNTIPSNLGNYPNAQNADMSFPLVRNGWSYGADAQLGFFFGRKRHFGIGIGVQYMYQTADMWIDRYHVEYQATDFRGDIFRQVINANGKITEKLMTNNLNIPLVLKYKNRFSKRIGFTADAGVLFNVMTSTDYNTNAAFDYEAVYRYVPNESGGVTATYPTGSTPLATDILYTRAHASENHSEAELSNYFNNLRNAGYSVGLNMKPAANSGNVTYDMGSIGMVLRPAISVYLSDNVALNFGLNYTYQNFTRSTNAQYRLADGSGNYNSAINSVIRTESHTYGLVAGARFFFGKPRDKDKDGIPDKMDKCPDVVGLARFDGCPDTDGDGIPDKEDSCATVFGLAIYHGCPDTDGDGITDRSDACPTQAGPRELNGCPDRDNDGIADRDDECPDKAGIVAFHGCPDTDSDGIRDLDDRCPEVAGPLSNQGCPYDTTSRTEDTTNVAINISTPLLFETNMAVLRTESYPVLDEAVRKLKENNRAYIQADGYCDSTGTRAYNKALSKRRGNAVKDYLRRNGIAANRIVVIGHGEDDAVAPNETYEGRQRNRRAVMKLKRK